MLCGDLHSHTTWSDGDLSPGERVISAMRSGNSLMAVTDHDELRGSIAAIKFAENFNLPITIPTGIEFSTDRGHILVYGLKNNPYEGEKGSSFENVRKLADEQDAFLVFAHPDWSPNKIKWDSGKIHQERLDGDYDAFEIINMEEDYSGLIKYYDEHSPFPIVCGSDSHHLKHGNGATLWVDSDNNVTDCFKAIKNAKVAIYISPELKGRKETAIGKELWLGDKTVIKKAKKLKRNSYNNDSEIKIEFEGRNVFPRENIQLNLSSEKDVNIELIIPSVNIKETIELKAIQTKTYNIRANENLPNEYLYAVVKHNGGYEIAAAYVATPVQVRNSIEGFRITNESSQYIIEKKSNFEIDANETKIFKMKTNPEIFMTKFTS